MSVLYYSGEVVAIAMTFISESQFVYYYNFHFYLLPANSEVLDCFFFFNEFSSTKCNRSTYTSMNSGAYNTTMAEVLMCFQYYIIV